MQDQYWSSSLACSTEVCLSMVAVVCCGGMRAKNPPDACDEPA